MDPGKTKDVSFTVIDSVVATIGPETESVRRLNVNVSLPSEVKSDETVNVIDPELDVTTKEPLVVFSAKSLAVTVPSAVQYNVVPSGTFVVKIVKTTEDPSSADVVEAVIRYVGVEGPSSLLTLLPITRANPKFAAFPNNTFNGDIPYTGLKF
jgi:hypothetical protein